MISWLFNRTARRFAGVDFMDLIPAQKVDHEQGSEDGQVILLIPRYSGPVWGRLLQPFMNEEKKHIKLPLDPRGALLWGHMDGKTKVADLVDVFGDNFEDDKQDVAERLSGYLFSMWENNFIVFSNLP